MNRVSGQYWRHITWKHSHELEPRGIKCIQARSTDPHEIKDFCQHHYAVRAELPNHPPELDVHRLGANGLRHHVRFFSQPALNEQERVADRKNADRTETLGQASALTTQGTSESQALSRTRTMERQE